MLPKVCAVCFGLMADMAKKISKKMEKPVEVIVFDGLLDDDWCPPEWMNDVDVFLSSGYNAYKLKSKISKPIISMETRLSDLLLALDDALTYDKDTLMVPYDEEFAIFEQLSSLLSIKVKQKPFKTPEQLKHILTKYQQSGGRSVVVAGLGYEYAKELGLKPFFIRPVGALMEYLNIAMDMAVSLRRSLHKNTELMTIINYYDKGIILATNDMITICNPLAAKCFHYLNRPIVGMGLLEIMTEIRFANARVDVHDLHSPILNNVGVINGTFYTFDFVPIRIKELPQGIMMNISALENEAGGQRNALEEKTARGFVAKYSFQMLSDKSHSFNKAVNLARYYSQTEESIVILGESGVGKEIMAHAIHNNSKRAKYPFVVINCSAMNEKLLESELFGYDEGAFTGAKKGGKEGFFEMANKGTIFLDEIGEINTAIQVKLLRTLQEKEIMRVGGTKVIRFDARIIVATNKNLWQLVEEKAFREDLYYRINVLELTIPPLRERREDIYTLFSTFLSASSPNIISVMATREKDITELLNQYDWPGNIRELNNFSKMVAAMMSEEQSLERLLDAMGEIIHNWMKRRKHLLQDSEHKATSETGILSKESFDKIKRATEVDEINAALLAAGGNKKRAAENLGIDRSTLWRKLKKYEP